MTTKNNNIDDILDFLENNKMSMRDNDYKLIIEFLYKFKVRSEKQLIEKTYIPYNPLRYFLESPRGYDICMFCNKKGDSYYYCNYRRDGKCGRIMCRDCSISHNATRNGEGGYVYFIADDLLQETCTHCYLNDSVKNLSEYSFVENSYVNPIKKFLKIEKD